MVCMPPFLVVMDITPLESPWLQVTYTGISSIFKTELSQRWWEN